MGKIGKSYPRAGGHAISFHEPRTHDHSEDHAMRGEIFAAVVALLSVLGLIGWAMALVT